MHRILNIHARAGRRRRILSAGAAATGFPRRPGQRAERDIATPRCVRMTRLRCRSREQSMPVTFLRRARGRWADTLAAADAGRAARVASHSAARPAAAHVAAEGQMPSHVARRSWPLRSMIASLSFTARSPRQARAVDSNMPKAANIIGTRFISRKISAGEHYRHRRVAPASAPRRHFSLPRHENMLALLKHD